MIPYKAYIITSIIIIKLIENYFNFRQYRRLKENRPIPKELISVGLEQSKHEESQKYSLAKIKILMISNFIQNTVNILFIYYNINPIKYDIAKRLCVNIPYIKFNPENEYGPLFCFIFLEFILLKIIDLPSSFILRMIENSLSASCGVKTAVGSSKISISLSWTP